MGHLRGEKQRGEQSKLGGRGLSGCPARPGEPGGPVHGARAHPAGAVTVLHKEDDA